MSRPKLTDNQKHSLVQKLEPYLKSGLSLRKACCQSQVPRSTVYYFMKKDPEFLDQIRRFQQFISVMLTNTLFRQLFNIVEKQQRQERLIKTDLQFLQWFALNSGATKGEYGRRVNVDLYDPEVEIQRIATIIDNITV